jgi:large subunit ribosomal protein L30
MTMARITVTYRKSGIGYNQVQKDTLRKLGFTRLNQSVVHDDTPAIRGMINRVVHLVDVAEEVTP